VIVTTPKSPKAKSNAPDREELLQMAIAAAKAGQTEGARVMLRQILEQDRRNERAMMWMAKIADSKSEREQWLRKVLEMNPTNERARDSLEQMQYSDAAKQNRTLLIGGIVIAVLVVLVVVTLFIVFNSR
jgi:thioredoxin-like negative regulator of GroEL